MIDQLIIGNTYSYDDFEANMKERKISEPKKKIIKETVPFSNVTYDFSAMNGEIYWEERELEYVFEITAMTPEQLEEKRIAFVTWIMNVQAEVIQDPFILDYHFIGTFEDISFEDEVEKTTITVRFTAYPYMIANRKKEYLFELPASEELSVKVTNNSSHRITPTLNSDVRLVIQKGDKSFSLSAGKTTDDTFKLEVGVNTFVLQNLEDVTGTLRIEFHEEVL